MTIATTKQGQIKGIEKFGSLQFRGIPFAAPPVGELRWMPPQPPASWDGVRDGSEFGPICPQLAGTMERLSGGKAAEPDPQSEDCLTLNVFTPASFLDGDERRPVMVWIHGGGFAGGSGRVPWYSGHNFARDGVVVVTVNYRLNAFGALHLADLFGEDFAESGSLGIQDQVAALEWVSDNIANFGGDPDDVTIFGESAGGMSVATLMAAPSARGLFSKAIPQSGAGHATTSPEVGARIAKRFCAVVGVEPGDRAALDALTTEQVIAGVEAVGASLQTDNDLFGEDWAGMSMPFQPIWGGSFLPKAPIEAIAGGSAAEITTLVGTTLEEWKLFTLMLPPEALRTRAVRPLRNLCAKAGRSPDEVVAAYESKLGGEPSELDLRNALETDRNFRIPAIRLAEAQVNAGANVWMYRFDWRTPAFDGAMGACHALEIPFVFDNLDAPGVDIFTGGEAPQPLADRMHAAWVAFAKTGAPNVGSLPTWPRYDLTERQTMVLGTECSTVSDPDGDTRELWTGLL